MEILDPNNVIKAIGAVFASYGLIGMLSGRTERWMALGFIAVGQFCLGLLSTADGSYEFGALGAGFAAYNGYLWWQGGGEKQVVKLRQRMVRKDGA